MRAGAVAFALAFFASARAYAQTEPSAEALETARRLFAEGVTAAEQNRWEEARERFTRAFEIHHAPSIRFNLALAHQNTGNILEAIEHYRQFLREVTDGTEGVRMAAARAQIDALSPRLAQLRVETTGDTARSFALDGRAQPLAMLGVDVPVNPGPHTVDVEGAAGDRQRREGAVYESERMRVSIELSPTPAIRPAGVWQPRSQPFGHWVARPGPDGRWIDWASRAATERVSVWELHPFTLALQGGIGTPTGVASLSARYFPQAWFGAEASVGMTELPRPTAGLALHLRLAGALGSRHALGLMVGGSAADVKLTNGPDTRDILAVMVSAGLTSEWRFGAHWTLRASAGVRTVVNPAEFRALATRTRTGACEAVGFSLAEPPVCELARGNDPEGPLVNPYAALDFGYSF